MFNDNNKEINPLFNTGHYLKKKKKTTQKQRAVIITVRPA